MARVTGAGAGVGVVVEGRLAHLRVARLRRRVPLPLRLQPLGERAVLRGLQ